MHHRVLHVLLAVAIGAGLGSLLGYFGQCSSGTCPLTSTWWRGALYGGFIGLMLALSSRNS
jgi:hypothetical protein